MKFSIITPSHNTKYIKELEETILSNTYTNWEWIILLNNGAKYESTDSRIKIFESKINNGFVGALKKEACSYCTGDVIVEVDHDDLLTDDCLYELSKAYQNPKVGFVYSDNAKLSDDFVPYSSFYGWEHYIFNYKGKDLFAMKSQPIYPARIGYIWYAPDHVRSWRKDLYEMVGGHNENMDVLDDQDLMHKLYMVTEFYHIPKVLYVYRITGDNTWLQRNEKIQNLTVEIFNANITLLAERFAEKNKLMKIDLCGGFNKPKGYISIDKFGGDIEADLDEGIPLPDGSCGVVRAFDALEHIKDTQHIMKEIHRVLAVGGVLISHTPSTDGRGAWQDPTHISFFNQNSFLYWTRPELAKYIRNDKWMFREGTLYTHFPSEWHKQNNVPYVMAILEKLP